MISVDRGATPMFWSKNRPSPQFLFLQHYKPHNTLIKISQNMPSQKEVSSGLKAAENQKLCS